MRLSIVTTMYGTASLIGELYGRLCSSAKKLTDDFEIIFVNDGSPDNALENAIELQKSDARIKVVDLSRNFGHHKAVMTGLGQAKGELVFLIDSNLKEDPELLKDFYEKLKESEVDVVFGVQRERQGSLFRKISGALYYSLIRWLSDVQVPRNLVTVRLMTKRYVKSLLSYREREVYLAGLMLLTGFAQLPLEITRKETGQTSYTIRRRISMMVNAITSLSNKPLIYIFYAGLILILLSIFYILYLVAQWAFFEVGVPGWTTTVISIFLLSGIIILFQGIIGIYLAKIFVETKQRPYTTIRAIYDKTFELPSEGGDQ